MHHSTKKALLKAVFALSLLGSSLLDVPARAADTVWLAHRAIRNKIMKEASDRYGVQFQSTHADKLPGGLRVVTGKGMFRRHRKTPQTFTYHTTIDIHDNSDRDTGYSIQ